ncbi:MAG: glycosyltransferase family 4 protein, partial [Anaerolineaceae bacterium]|nr:glycosyltransferase family 4 protein [Anaerolineaceae bacterium]
MNPRHYGTSENALLEAMTMGVVPVVIDNPTECSLVIEGKTGLIVKSPDEFAEAIVWLKNNPASRLQIGQQAATYVRENFPPQKLIAEMESHYR